MIKIINSSIKFLQVAVLVISSVMASPGISAQAEEESIIYAEPLSGPVGTVVTIDGIFFTPSVLEGITSNATRLSEAKIYFPDKETFCKSAVIDTWGKLNTTLEIGEYPAGSYQIWIHDETAGPLAWISVPFTITPEITLDKTSGYISDTVKVSGTGFDELSTIRILYDGRTVATTVTNELGSFNNASIIVPDQYNNDYDIKAKDNTGNEAYTTFTSQRQKIVIYPNSGGPGKEINVSGSGFDTSENITFKIYSPGTIINDIVTDPEYVKSDDEGCFDIKLTIPVCTNNIYVLEAFDGSFRASTSLSVSSSGFFDRNMGCIGSNITFAGNGFVPFKYSVAYFDDIPLAEAKVDINGVSQVSFVVPVCLPGDHIVTVTDGISSYSYTFTVISNASVDINRTKGSVGSQVLIKGTGFVPGKVAIISFDEDILSEVTVNSTQGFSANFTIPACDAGTHTVSVSEGINNIVLSLNIYGAGKQEEIIPILSLITEDNSEISGTDAVLIWTELPDQNNVNYIVQIATDRLFNSESLVAQSNCSFETMYIFTPDVTLLTGTESNDFYWRVKADIDGVSGEWTESRMFTMSIPVVTEEESNPIISYGIYGEIGALLCLLGFWFVKKKRNAAVKPSTVGSEA